MTKNMRTKTAFILKSRKMGRIWFTGNPFSNRNSSRRTKKAHRGNTRTASVFQRTAKNRSPCAGADIPKMLRFVMNPMLNAVLTERKRQAWNRLPKVPKNTGGRIIRCLIMKRTALSHVSATPSDRFGTWSWTAATKRICWPSAKPATVRRAACGSGKRRRTGNRTEILKNNRRAGGSCRPLQRPSVYQRRHKD